MKNILFITPSIGNNTGGRNLTDNILHVLKEKYNIIFYSIPSYGPSKIKKLILALRGYSHGYNSSEYKSIKKIITNHKINAIVFNHSYYGNLIKKVKKEFKNIPIITYFHNIEYKFHLDIVRREKGIGHWLMWRVISKNEKYAVLYSDYTIGLNARDNQMLKEIYNRSFDKIIPMFLPDIFKSRSNEESCFTLPKKYGLFVGSLFYANHYGIKWISENVCPYISIPIVVIGKGFEKVKNEFQHVPNLLIIGEVPSLNHFYNNAEFVISPIFDGSGMKTKTAEAFMFGKNVIGTSETFQGYDITDKKTAYLANTKDEFISIINNYQAGNFNPTVRKLYETYYSIEANANSLKNFFDSIFKESIE